MIKNGKCTIRVGSQKNSVEYDINLSVKSIFVFVDPNVFQRLDDAGGCI